MPLLEPAPKCPSRLGVLFIFILLGTGAALTGLPSASLAQVATAISGDNTLGTTVNGSLTGVCAGGCTINGGTILGNNQFHSLGLFNVGTFDTATFSGPGGIANILTRVTGGGSQIDGTIQTTIPGANLFLMNPAGIVFGPNAFLDIGTSVGQGGSFYATTASYLRLGTAGDPNAGIFHADPAVSSVLTSAPVTAFGFLKTTPGSISVESSQLFAFDFDPANAPTLALVGGSVDVTDGAFLLASGGKLLLAGTAWSGSGAAAEVTLPTGTTAPAITGSVSRLPITVSGGTLLDVSDQVGVAEGRGGTVYIRGGQFTVNNASINSFTAGAADGNTAGIDINVTSMTATGSGTTVEAGVLETFFGPATGKGGSVVIDSTSGTVTISNSAQIRSSSQSAGTAGPLTITGNTLEVNGATIRTLVTGGGPAEPLTVTVDTLRVLNGGLIITQTSSGTPAGPLTATANQSFLVSGTNAAGTTRSAIRSLSGGGNGPTGNVIVQTGSGGSGTIEGGARIGGDNVVATQSGSIDVQVPNGILTITGRDNAGTASAILNVSLSNGQSGPINVNAGTLLLTDGGLIQSTSGAAGSVGTVTITAQTLTVNNGSIEASTIGPGRGGNVNITTSQHMVLKNQGVISAKSSLDDPTAGDAGDLVIKAGNFLQLDNSSITTESIRTNGGNITVQAKSLVQLNNSQITTSVKNGVGGNISIDPDSVILQNGSKIIAQAITGSGGNITIVAGSLLQDPSSQISASSEFGQSGTVSIQSPLTNLSESVVGLPQTALQAKALLVARCAAKLQGGQTSSFVQVGRDSLPAGPDGLLASPLLAPGGSGSEVAQAPAIQPDGVSLPTSGEVRVSVRRIRSVGPLAGLLPLERSVVCD